MHHVRLVPSVVSTKELAVYNWPSVLWLSRTAAATYNDDDEHDDERHDDDRHDEDDEGHYHHHHHHHRHRHRHHHRQHHHRHRPTNDTDLNQLQRSNSKAGY